MYLSLYIYIYIYIYMCAHPPTHTHTDTHNHILLNGSHATAAVMISSLAWCPNGYWGKWNAQVSYVLHCLSIATVISAHWHMDYVNHDNMQYAMCVYVFYGHSTTAEPQCSLCVLSTLDSTLYCHDCWETFWPIWQQRVSQKVNITFLTYFWKKNHYGELGHELFTVCVCF